MPDPDTLRLVFVGTKDFAVPTFLALLDQRFAICALVTQPERPQGRKQELVPARIKAEAQSRGVPVLQPESINDSESVAKLRALAPDVLVTVAYGQILSPEVLSIPKLGAINLHGSILPAYRGAAPVARAIQRGETESGVTVIQMDPRVDAGAILAVARTPIDPDETAGELEARLATLGAPLVWDVVQKLAAGTASPLTQDSSRVSRAPKLKKDEGRIAWSKSARAIHNLVRAMQPWPMASTHWLDPDDEEAPLRVIVHKTQVVLETAQKPPGRVHRLEPGRVLIATGDGVIELLEVQLPGKKAVPIEAFLRGHRLNPGGWFGGPDRMA
jgi:methionyl-tRNA formyltransferase